MNATDKLTKLISLCKYSIDLEINEHRVTYTPARQALFESAQIPHNFHVDLTSQVLEELEIDKETMDKMIDTDTIIRIHFFPRTANGSYEIYGYDLGVCLDECLSVFENKKESLE